MPTFDTLTDVQMIAKLTGGEHGIEPYTLRSALLTLAARGVTMQAQLDANLTGPYTISMYVHNIAADKTVYFVVPIAGTVATIYTTIDAAVDTADCTMTFSGPGGAMANGVITIATAGSAAGDVDTCSPTTNNVVTAGQVISCVIAGAGGGSTPGSHVVLVLTRA